MHTILKPCLRALVASRRYAIEGFFAAFLMFCIELVVLAFEHPAYPARHLIHASWMRRACIGSFMGCIIALICATPWGKRSGAHMNPAVTLAFYILERIKGVDALAYIVAQVAGAIVGVGLAAALTQGAVAHPDVDYAVTSVGLAGAGWAFLAEGLMAFLLMSAVLWTSSRPKLARYTPGLAGVMIALFITVEGPLSGMSINPARSLSAGLLAGHLERLWLYALAPTAGMLGAALVFRMRRRALPSY